MKVIVGYPPNFDEIKAKFNPPERVIFTYGDTIYSPNGSDIPEDLVTHEATHMKQQGNYPATWWHRYIENEEFRLGEELEAYRNQWTKYKSLVKDRNFRAVFLNRIAADLAGPIYGNIIDFDMARKMIKL